MKSHHSAKFGGHRHCGSEDMMFLEVEGQDYICPRFSLPLLFIKEIYIYKGNGLKVHGISYQ